MVRPPKSVGVKLNLHVLQIDGVWEPNDAERKAAWELYVELVTRVSVVPLREDEGLLREALSSLYSLFGTTRDVLRRHGPDVAQPKRQGQYNFGYLAVAILNYGLRPLLSHWHPLLDDWESRRPADRSRLDHERAWAQAAQLRAALTDTRRLLVDYVDLLADACGVPNLASAVPPDE
ncbi:hypothetical protein [Streptantibioticus ferralitis]|uniref:Uncharacterized protein n=1 Tax=Streptantibioticus ferralitis TaxID=236510 RepID=A0ABT5ZD17_9ACTN|nr:hypothetical protein [Streptantibioticus ferralitis]MDF2261588.1 hypothetical protein [Streptantibioticus ferralitis]